MDKIKVAVAYLTTGVIAGAFGTIVVVEAYGAVTLAAKVSDAIIEKSW